MIALIAAMAAGNTYAAKKKTDDAPPHTPAPHSFPV